MESISLSLPESWSQLSDEQLTTVFRLISLNLSSPEIKTLCLFKWNKLRVISKSKDGKFWLKKGKSILLVTSTLVQALTSPMDFIDDIPSYPVRVEKIGLHKAAPEDFEGVPFEQFLVCDNYFQGYLHTKNIDILKEMLQLLYNIDDVSKVKNIEAYAVMAFYWFASLKQLFARRFPHFYVPIGEVTESNMMETTSLHQKLTNAVNAQIRALTGGDVTKEPYVMQMDTHRALTELDAKARDAEEMNKKK